MSTDDARPDATVEDYIRATATALGQDPNSAVAHWRTVVGDDGLREQVAQRVADQIAAMNGWPGRGDKFQHVGGPVADALMPLIAQAQARVLRDFADATRFPNNWILFRRDDGSGVTVPDLLRETANRIERTD